jgi:hydrogenase maturation factor
MLRRVALVRTDVSEELSSSFIRVTRIGELGTTKGVTGNRRKLRRNTSVILKKGAGKHGGDINTIKLKVRFHTSD